MSTVTGSAVARAIRARLSMARSIGTSSPSLKPLAAATDQLPVAIARAPDAATAFAVPGSQMLNSTKGRPGTWSARKSSAFLFASVMALCRQPMAAQFAIEFLGAFFGKEDPCSLELDPLARAGNGLGQPMRPLDVEIDVVRAPGDQRRHLQRPQLRLHRDGVLAVEGGEEALEVARALLGSQQGPQVGLDGLVGDPIGVFIGR